MACGEKYANLVRSATGRTPQNPCAGILSDLPVIGDVDIYCNVGDWEDWKLGMESLQTRVAAKLSALQKAAVQKGRADIPQRIQAEYLNAAVNSYNLAISEGPSGAAFPGSASIMEGILRAVTTDELYACALEQIDLGFAELGLQAPETAAPHPGAKDNGGGTDWMKFLKNAGIAVGASAFAYLLLKYYLAKRQRAELARASAPPSNVPPPPTGSWSKQQ